jgi:hypothetical protein
MGLYNNYVSTLVCNKVKVSCKKALIPPQHLSAHRSPESEYYGFSCISFTQAISFKGTSQVSRNRSAQNLSLAGGKNNWTAK